jgi:hypothetical protein
MAERSRVTEVRYWWIIWITMEPSPIAEATLLIEACLASPTAKTPDMSVSIYQGKALQVLPSSGTTIAGEVLVGDNVALLVALDLLGQPACVGLSSDEDEQGGRRDGLRGRGGGVLEDEVLEPSLPIAVDNLSVSGDPRIL